MRRTSILSTAACAVVLAFLSDAPASAQQAKCLSGKTLCMSKKTAGMLKCEALAATPGKPVDPNANDCLTKVAAKWDGASNPAKGCFERLENKATNDCLTVDDAAPAGAAIDGCVASLIAAIDPPPLDQTQCGAGKRKCVSKYVGALLKCRRSAQTPGKPVDPNANGCVDKAVAKFTGGVNPAKAASRVWRRRRRTTASSPAIHPRCRPWRMTATDDLGAVLTCGDGNLDPGETCDGADAAACPGACLADCTCPAAPVCGNGVREGSEACDGADDGNCPGECTSDCGCASCFDHVAVDYPEACFAYSGFGNQPSCKTCCDADPDCHSACMGAAANGCILQSPTHHCALYVNFAGCAAECCNWLPRAP